MRVPSHFLFWSMIGGFYDSDLNYNFFMDNTTACAFMLIDKRKF